MTTTDLRRTTKAQLAEALEYSFKLNESFQEAITELELRVQDRDFEWSMLGGESELEFSYDALREIIRLSRIMYLKNPLIQRAVRVQSHYVFGQSFSVSSDDVDVNATIQRFMDDSANVKCITGHQASLETETELTVTGNLFLAMFTNRTSGRVVLRLIPVEEINEIICNPEDNQEPWYYRRTYQSGEFNSNTGTISPGPRTVYYPDWQYNPTSKPTNIGGAEVIWDAPVYHTKIGGFQGMKFGVPEMYAALDWAKAVKSDLEDYASLRRSLSRWAWRVTTGGGARGVSALKSKFNTTIGDGSGQGETNPPPTVGGMFISTESTNLEPVRTAGAAPHPDEGRRLWLMVSAGSGIPETILAGDADVGNLATARTLDRPTELQMADRVELWKSIYEDILSYVIRKAIETPKGLLRTKGRLVRDDYTGGMIVEINSDVNTHVDVEFPSILEKDVESRVRAVISAATLDSKSPAHTMTFETLVRQLLTAIGMDDIDEEWTKLQPELEQAEEQRQTMAQLFHQPGQDGEAGEEDSEETQEERESRVTRKLMQLDEVLRGANGYAIH